MPSDITWCSKRRKCLTQRPATDGLFAVMYSCAACNLCVCTGLCLRVIITFFIMGNRRYNWKERLFYAVAWTPKATVQASLSAVPLALINSVMKDSPDYAQWQQWGEDCLATGIFAIIVCATLGTLFVFWLAPVLLEKEVRPAYQGIGIWSGHVAHHRPSIPSWGQIMGSQSSRHRHVYVTHADQHSSVHLVMWKRVRVGLHATWSKIAVHNDCPYTTVRRWMKQSHRLARSTGSQENPRGHRRTCSGSGPLARVSPWLWTGRSTHHSPACRCCISSDTAVWKCHFESSLQCTECGLCLQQ